MKKTGFLLLSVVMAVMLVLTGCGDGGGSPVDSGTTPSENGSTDLGTGGKLNDSLGDTDKEAPGSDIGDSKEGTGD
ncbi:Uncharacterised protein [Chlamydia abortus]|uniref:Lipoprotein n=1 Tax=Paenibacillus residui TaxID=629724 RepID=A0ABW3D5S0_9BACL|nr:MULTISPECIES: hypothetical protein [Paenibacillaceae]SHE12497.1 Uncharacterised protein [Chlamydia abortus]